jgi:hypothetical protein
MMVMKKNVLITTVLLVISSFSVDIAAQENIEALIKKCVVETMDSVDINVARMKDKTDITSIHIHSNSGLVNEFLEAFKKDEEKTSESIIQRKEGNVKLNYKFEDITYSLITQGKNKAMITKMKIVDSCEKVIRKKEKEARQKDREARQKERAEKNK